MYVGKDWDSADAGYEDDVFGLDFVKDVNIGETISSVVVFISVVIGTDATPSSRLIGFPSVSGTVCSQQIDVRSAPGGVYYRVTMVIATNQRVAVALWSHFWSRSPN